MSAAHFSAGFTLAMTADAAQADPCLVPADVRLLSAIGFMAAKSGCLVPALRIFESLHLLRPQAAFPLIGMAVAYMAVAMPGEAVHVLRERASECCLGTDDLRPWLCLALQQSGNQHAALKEFRVLTEDLPAESWSPMIRRLALLLGARTDTPDWPMPASVSDTRRANSPD
jgi:hypothetical protein